MSTLWASRNLLADGVYWLNISSGFRSFRTLSCFTGQAKVFPWKSRRSLDVGSHLRKCHPKRRPSTPLGWIAAANFGGRMWKVCIQHVPVGCMCLLSCPASCYFCHNITILHAYIPLSYNIICIKLWCFFMPYHAIQPDSMLRIVTVQRTMWCCHVSRSIAVSKCTW